MAKYRDQFRLMQRDIELIESALRNEISQLAELNVDDSINPDPHRARELTRVLAKIYHQKIFYSQVNSTGVPGG
jgi:hypothetical protein